MFEVNDQDVTADTVVYTFEGYQDYRMAVEVVVGGDVIPGLTQSAMLASLDGWAAGFRNELRTLTSTPGVSAKRHFVLKDNDNSVTLP